MVYYRVSKYDPQYRIGGIYRKDEWTSMSDIGSVYDGKTFTEDEYNKVEGSYVDFVLDVCELQNTDRLIVMNLENQNNLSWNNGQRLNACQIVDFIKSCLREECWGRLVSNDFVFETGYEYYIHIGCNLSLDDMKRIARRNNLFVEVWEQLKEAY